MVKRRNVQERDEATAHEQAEARREALLAELKAREAASRPAPVPPPAPERAEAGTDSPPEPIPAEGDATEPE